MPPTQSNRHTGWDPWHITDDMLLRPRTNHPKMYREPQKTLNCQSNPEEHRPSRRHNPCCCLDVRHYGKAAVIRTVWDWYKLRHTDQWNGTETQKETQTPAVNWYSTKVVRIDNGEKTVSSASGAGKTGHLHVNRWNWNAPSHHAHKETQDGLNLNH